MIYRQAIAGVVMCFLILGLHGWHQPSWADESVTPWVSRIVSIQGRVLAKRLGQAE